MAAIDNAGGVMDDSTPVRLPQMMPLGYNYSGNHIKSGQMLEASTHPFSSRERGADTMSDFTPNALAFKTCPNCKETKPDSSFGIRKTGRDAGQRRSWCKSCESAYKRANRSRYAEHEAMRRAANREEFNARMRAYQSARPERRGASNAVNNAVHAGKMPHVSTLACVVCNGQAEHYHHHLGYAPEHWLDVVAICHLCHEKEHHANV